MDLGSTILTALPYEVAIANALRSQDFYEQDSQGATDCASFYPSSSVPFQAQVTLPRKVHRSVGQICNEKSFYFLKQFSQRVANKNSIFPMTSDIQFYYKKGIRSIPFLTFEINLGEVDKKSGFLPP